MITCVLLCRSYYQQGVLFLVYLLNLQFSSILRLIFDEFSLWLLSDEVVGEFLSVFYPAFFSSHQKQ